MRCKFLDGVTVKPDSVHELDPCLYKEVERYHNVTVSVMKCQRCGHIEIEWVRQPNTRRIMIKE